MFRTQTYKLHNVLLPTHKLLAVSSFACAFQINVLLLFSTTLQTGYMLLNHDLQGKVDGLEAYLPYAEGLCHFLGLALGQSQSWLPSESGQPPAAVTALHMETQTSP